MRLAAVAILGLLPMSGEAACRQALALGLDVSGSVDDREYRLQTDGLAGALLRGDVQDAFLAFPEAPIRVFVFEWAGAGNQRVLIPWTEVQSSEDLQGIAGRLRTTSRVPFEPTTGIGDAMIFGAAAANPQNCWRATLDLSGDGESNSGPRPRDVKDDPILGALTINGLVIGSDTVNLGAQRQDEIGKLWAYYQTEVIKGPNAFVEVAVGFENFEEVMARKLLKEMETLAVSSVSPLPTISASQNTGSNRLDFSASN